MLQRVYPEVAQNAAGQGTESGAAGLSCRYNYDMDSKRTGKAEKEIMKMQIFVDADACPVVGIVEEIAKNNLSENSIRPLVVGRKNWLFCDTPAGADASMKIYSMIETAKANELDPLKYLSFLLEHRPGAEMSDEELEQFAPWSKLAQETCK